MIKRVLFLSLILMSRSQALKFEAEVSAKGFPTTFERTVPDDQSTFTLKLQGSHKEELIVTIEKLDNHKFTIYLVYLSQDGKKVCQAHCLGQIMRRIDFHITDYSNHENDISIEVTLSP